RSFLMSKMIFKRADGSVKVSKGYKKKKPNNTIPKFAGSKVNNLPSKVDLRKYMTGIEDQGDLNSCTANAVAGAYEYLFKRHKGIDSHNVSRLYIYYNARDWDGTVDEDDGCTIEGAIEGIKEYGACSEKTWPYDEDMYDEEPSDEAYEEGEKFLVEDVKLVPIDLKAWKSALAEGHPIVFGIDLFKTFDSHKKPGLVPMPSKKESAREEHGGHAMLCVGYSDQDKVFIVRNSWGDDWGDDGYCYIPYDYLINEDFNDGDTWIIRKLENLDLDESTWSDDKESVLGELESEISEMSDDDYEEMLDEMGDYPLEFRIGYILMYAAYNDDELSDEEYDEISKYMQEVLEKLGVKMSAKKILKHIEDELEDDEYSEELLEESVELLGEYLSKPLLATLYNDIKRIIGVDDLSEDEEEFLEELVSAWQVGNSEDEEDED
ncbi:MAG: C1 family peptidase, partial [Leptospiraceae bacterium]|nr:C1 family peptidase [Leptospiraceae bacterium]